MASSSVGTSAIRLENVWKKYGDFDALAEVDLDISRGEFVVVVGPSGSGKTTLLRLISGLMGASEGRIFIDGQDVTDRGGDERDLAMVFQDYALYPHMTVRQNIRFGLVHSSKRKGESLSKETINDSISQVAELLDLTALLDKKPPQLSGGQRQRTALARAIVRKPAVLLLDEPLSALDPQLRDNARRLIKSLHQQLGTTMVMVTHDQEEALSMADTIVVMKDGHLVQADSPERMFSHPANRFVASFIGRPEMNFSDVEGGGSVGWRPDRGVISSAGAAASLIADSGLDIRGTVESVEFFGNNSNVLIASDSGSYLVSVNARDAIPSVGDEVVLQVSAADLHFFNESGTAVEKK